MTSHGQRFRRRALRRGYKVDEVDAFLERVEATVAGEPVDAPVTAEEVRDVAFRTGFGGYDEWQVDLHLDRVERQLTEAAGPDPHGGQTGQMAPPPLPSRPTGGRQETGYGQFDDTYVGGEPAYGGYQNSHVESDMTTEMRATDHGGAAPPGPGYENEGPYGAYPSPGGHPPQSGQPYGGHPQPAPPQQPAPHPSSPPYGGGQEPGGQPYGGPPHYPGGQQPEHGGHPQPGGAYPPAPEPGGPPPAGPPYGGENGAYPQSGQPHGSQPVPPHGGGQPYGGQPHGGQPQGGQPYDGQPYGGPPQSGAPYGGPPQSGAPYGGPPQSGAPYGGGPDQGGPPDQGPPTGYGPAISGPPAGAPPEVQRVDQLRRSFQPRRFGSGYDRGQVDQLFAEVIAGMTGQGPLPDPEGRLDPRRFELVSGGYFEAEVDQALREVRDILRGQ